jgi:hypothetical protein
VLGDPSPQTFKPLWDEVVSKGKCYFYVTDGGKVYPIWAVINKDTNPFKLSILFSRLFQSSAIVTALKN